MSCSIRFGPEPPEHPWGGVQPKFDTLARIGERRYVLRGRHAITGEPVEVPLAGGATFRMRRPKRPGGGET